MNFNKLVRIARNTKEVIDTKQKHFSFILLKNNIISFGWNQSWKTHPLAARFNHRFNNIHSEISAIKNMQKNWALLTKCRLVNIRIRSNGELGLSKPCRYCLKAIIDFDIREVYYSNENGDFDLLK